MSNSQKDTPADQIEWVCLEKDCDLRLMTSKQAVKLHDRNHRVDEYSAMLSLGIFQIFYSQILQKQINKLFTLTIVEKTIERYSKAIDCTTIRSILEEHRKNMQSIIVDEILNQENEQVQVTAAKIKDTHNTEVKSLIEHMNSLKKHEQEEITKIYQQKQFSEIELFFNMLVIDDDTKGKSFKNYPLSKQKEVLSTFFKQTYNRMSDMGQEINLYKKKFNRQTLSKKKINLFNKLSDNLDTSIQLILQNEVIDNIVSLYKQECSSIGKQSSLNFEEQTQQLQKQEQDWDKKNIQIKDAIQNAMKKLAKNIQNIQNGVVEHPVVNHQVEVHHNQTNYPQYFQQQISPHAQRGVTYQQNVQYYYNNEGHQRY